MRLLITAGPTREYLDPVRFITNGSSGKMGYACAVAALRRGHQVTLVSGPVALAAPEGAALIRVVSSEQMGQVVRRHFEQCDCVIMAAAVGDYRPVERQSQKIKKTAQQLNLQLEKTVDILAGLGQAKTHQTLIGFAVEDHAARQNARRKMLAKNLDAIVLNSPAALGASHSDAQILCPDGTWQRFEQVRKEVLATAIVKLAEKLREPG